MAKQVLFGYKVVAHDDSIVADSGEPHLVSLDEAIEIAKLRAKRAFPQPVEWVGINSDGFLTGYVRPFAKAFTKDMVYVAFTQAEIAL